MFVLFRDGWCDDSGMQINRCCGSCTSSQPACIWFCDEPAANGAGTAAGLRGTASMLAEQSWGRCSARAVVSGYCWYVSREAVNYSSTAGCEFPKFCKATYDFRNVIVAAAVVLVMQSRCIGNDFIATGCVSYDQQTLTHKTFLQKIRQQHAAAMYGRDTPHPELPHKWDKIQDFFHTRKSWTMVNYDHVSHVTRNTWYTVY